MSAEHGELRSAALQSVGSVVQQHSCTADWSVCAQWMAGAELRSLRTDLGSAGLQVSTRDDAGSKEPLESKRPLWQTLFSCSRLVSVPSLNLIVSYSASGYHHGNTKWVYTTCSARIVLYNIPHSNPVHMVSLAL